MSKLNELAAEINTINEAHGFDFDANDPLQVTRALCLIHSEISEALEELRSGSGERIENGKPEGLGVEVIDGIIRSLHLLHKRGIDIDAVLRQKLEFNKSRPFKHGRKF